MEYVALTIFLLLFVAIYAGSAAWAVGDAQKRGSSGGIIFLLFWLFGPLSAIVWLLFRPSKRLDQRSHEDYSNADDAIAAASQLDTLGDWDAAIDLYRYTADRWQEQTDYIARCIDDIERKRQLADT